MATQQPIQSLERAEDLLRELAAEVRDRLLGYSNAIVTIVGASMTMHRFEAVYALGLAFTRMAEVTGVPLDQLLELVKRLYAESRQVSDMIREVPQDQKN